MKNTTDSIQDNGASTQKIGDSSESFGSVVQDLSGTTRGGYRLVRKIAEGGMGIVYEAIQLKLDRKVALKILTDQLASQPEFLPSLRA